MARLLSRELTPIEGRKELQKRLLNQSMIVLLTLEGKCSLFGSKPAHLVGHLPLLPTIDEWI